MLIVVPGNPIPKIRARITAAGAYDPQYREKKLYRLLIRRQYEKQKSKFAHKCSVTAYHISMYFYFAPTSSWSKKRKEEALTGKLKHTKKPDLDNLEKFIVDCGNGIIYPDDKMIVSQCSCKAYAKLPRTVMEIRVDFY